MNNVKISSKNKSLPVFHLNVCPLNKNSDDLQHVLSCKKNDFNIKGVTETRINKQVPLLNNLNLNNYAYEFTPTEITGHSSLHC